MAKRFLSQVPWEEVFEKEGIKVPSNSTKINCPFHKDANASLSFGVKNGKSIFKCFGCEAKGTVESFLCLLHENEYANRTQTLKAMAIKYDCFTSATSNNNIEEVIYKKICGLLTLLFWRTYARERKTFFATRGLNNDTFLDYKLGYVPIVYNGSTVLNEIKWLSNHATFKEEFHLDWNHPIVLKVIEDSKLFNSSDNFFTDDRYVIPIDDVNGDVIGFTCRARLSSESRKYMNNYATRFFDKKNLLFNYSRCQKADTINIFEAPMCAMSASQVGITACAVMGATLTDEQYHLLSNKEIILCLDNDDSGWEKSLSVAKAYPRIKIRDMTLFPYKDFSEALEKEGDAKAKELFESLPVYTAPEYILRRRLKEVGINSPTENSKTFKELFTVLVSKDTLKMEDPYVFLSALAEAFFQLKGWEDYNSENISEFTKFLMNLYKFNQ